MGASLQSVLCGWLQISVSRCEWSQPLSLAQLRPPQRSASDGTHMPPLKGAKRDDAQARFWPLTLGAVGVVYGDIGTSPIYAFREAAVAAKTVSAPNGKASSSADPFLNRRSDARPVSGKTPRPTEKPGE